jgi:hypothetical protein
VVIGDPDHDGIAVDHRYKCHHSPR